MPTRPATMPLTRPPTVTRPTMNTSRNIQAIMAVAAARFVLRMAAEASAPAKYGSPPLNPFQPSQSRPAPVITAIRLLGRLFSRSVSSRGPMTDAATRPDMPAATDAERVHRIHDGDPPRNEEHPGLEARASQDRAGEQDDSDSREHELEVRQRGKRELEVGYRADQQRDRGLSLQGVRRKDRARN